MVKQNEIDNTGTINTPNGTDLEDVIEEIDKKIYALNEAILETRNSRDYYRIEKEIEALRNKQHTFQQ